MSGLNASQDLQTSAQYTAINNFLTNDDTDLDDAHDQFCKPVEEAAVSSGSSNLQSVLKTSWQAIITTAAKTSWSSPATQNLVKFVLVLGQRPNVYIDGKSVEVEGMSVWSDLSTFGWQMRDAWNFAADDSSDEQSAQQWINLNGFTASLVAAAHSSTDDQPNFSLYCIWTVRQALEQSQPPSAVAVSAAAVWFISSASAIWDFSRQDENFRGKLAAPGPAFRDQGWTGFTRDRWRAWAQKLSDFHDQISDDSTVQLVQQARKAMGGVAEQ